MERPTVNGRVEARWPPALAILAVLLLLTAMPQRTRLLPAWMPYIVVVALLTPIAAVALTHGNARWMRIERATVFLFCMLAVLTNTATLAYLINEILLGSSATGGLQLLTSSVAVWVLNVLAFSLLYWRADRRASNETPKRHHAPIGDWLFPQDSLEVDLVGGWRPAFVDYLWLAFSTATAFSATEVAPLTARAKLLMMLESALSLATIVVVASRAINVLGN